MRGILPSSHPIVSELTENTSRGVLSWAGPLAFVGTIALIGALGWISAERRGQAADTEFRRTVLRHAMDMAGFLDPAVVRSLTFTVEDADQDVFDKISGLMKDYLNVLRLPDRTIYSVQRRGNDYHFGPQAAYPGDVRDTLRPGTLHDDPPPEADLVYDSGRPLVFGPRTGADDDVITALAPVYDSPTNEVLLLVGLDVPAHLWRAHIADAKRGVQIRASALALLVLLGGLLVQHKQRLPAPRRDRWKHLEIVLIAVYGVAFVTALGLRVHESELDERRKTFTQLAEMHAELTRDAFYHLELRMTALVNLFATRAYVSPDEFAEFSRPLLRSPALLATGWVADLKDGTGEAMSDSVALRKRQGFPVWEWDAEGANRVTVQAQGARPALYIAPAARQAALASFNHASEPALQHAMDRALTSPRSVGTALIRWPPTDETVAPHYYVYRPVLSESRLQDGLTLLVVDLQALLDKTFERLLVMDPAVEFSLTEMAGAERGFSVHYPADRTPDGHAGDACGESFVQPIPAMDRVFEFRARPCHEFLAAHPAHSGFIVWLAGIALTALVTTSAAAMRQRHHAHDLALSEKRYRQLFRAMSSGFMLCEAVTDANGKICDMRFIEVNEALDAHTGLNGSELIGRTMSETVPQAFPFWLSRFSEVALSGKSTRFTHYDLNNGRHYGVLAYCPEPGQCAVMLTDITRRKRMEEQVSRLEALQNLLIQTATRFIHIPTARIDQATEETLAAFGRFSRVDRAYQFRYDFKQGIMTNTHEWCAEAIRPAIDESQAIPAPADLDIVIVHKRGEPYYVPDVQAMPADHPLRPTLESQQIQSLVTIPLMAGRECRGFIGFDAVRARRTWSDEELALLKLLAQLLTNAHLRREQDTERQQLERQMQQAQKLESLGVMAGGIAHDFNNILTTILGNTDLALRDISSVSPARESLEAIETGALRAADLCRQMLAYAGKGRFVIETFSLNEVIREMLHLLKTSISKRARFNLHLEPDLPPIRGDASQIRQIILNLVINASEALEDRSGTIAVSTGAYLVEEHDNVSAAFDTDLEPGLYVSLEVTDTGVGMDEETLARVFDPFFTTKFSGRGLGLAAVTGIVRGHHGALNVTSTPGAGTTFHLLLPAVREEEDANTERVLRHSSGDVRHGTGTVLLADDEVSIRALTSQMLKRLGFTVLTATDGIETLDVFKANAGSITCVILDLTMPRMNGEEAFKELLKLDPNIPVILASGYSQAEITDRHVIDGMAAFIQKPFTLQNLAGVLKTVLEEKK